MNRKQFIFLLLAVATLGAAGLVLLNRNQQTWTAREAKAGDKVLPGFAINEVAAIHIKGKSDFNIARKNGLWCVPERSDYPANFQQISDLLVKLKDLKVLQSDLVGPSQLASLELAQPGNGPNSGSLFEFKNEQGKTLGALLVGKKHMRAQSASDPFRMKGLFDSCYVLLPNDPENVLLVSDDLTAAVPEAGSWLKRDFFKAENIKVISLISTNPAESWEISRPAETNRWILSDAKPGEVLNTKIASETAEILAFPTFVDVLPEAEAKKTAGLSPPAAVVTILADHFAFTLKISGKRPDGNYCLSVKVAGDIPSAVVSTSQQTELREKLAMEQSLARWAYIADPWIEMVKRTRSQLLERTTIAADHSAGR